LKDTDFARDLASADGSEARPIRTESLRYPVFSDFGRWKGLEHIVV